MSGLGYAAKRRREQLDDVVVCNRCADGTVRLPDRGDGGESIACETCGGTGVVAWGRVIAGEA